MSQTNNMNNLEGLKEPPPEHCPGPTSETAGKTSSCDGCPNQQVCSTGAVKQVDPDLKAIEERMSTIKHKILVLSGKGGVGKSTFSSQLSFALSMDQEREVGLLDIDICGPSIPKIMGLEGERIHISGEGWDPVYVQDNLAVMSVGFLLESEDEAVIWRGPKKNGLIKQFLKDVHWGDLDYLVVDTPPGTSDEHLSIVQYLKNSNIDGAVIVTSPQDISLIDVRKEINFCKKVSVPIIGVVENFSGFICPKCTKESQIFLPTSGGAEQMSKEMNVPFLGRIPIDPLIARSCDEGKNYLLNFPDSESTKQFNEIFKKIKVVVDSNNNNNNNNNNN